MEIRRSHDRLISTLGLPIQVRCYLYDDMVPWLKQNNVFCKMYIQFCLVLVWFG